MFSRRIAILSLFGIASAMAIQPDTLRAECDVADSEVLTYHVFAWMCGTTFYGEVKFFCERGEGRPLQIAKKNAYDRLQRQIYGEGYIPYGDPTYGEQCPVPIPECPVPIPGPIEYTPNVSRLRDVKYGSCDGYLWAAMCECKSCCGEIYLGRGLGNTRAQAVRNSRKSLRKKLREDGKTGTDARRNNAWKNAKPDPCESCSSCD